MKKTVYGSVALTDVLEVKYKKKVVYRFQLWAVISVSCVLMSVSFSIQVLFLSTYTGSLWPVQ